MKKFVLSAIAALAVQLPAWANQPFRYTTKCYVVNIEDECVVIETREKSGALKTRNIFSNKAGLTIKMRWVGDKFLTFDSFNKFEYHWVYKIVEGKGSEVMPQVYLENVSWD